MAVESGSHEWPSGLLNGVGTSDHYPQLPSFVPRWTEAASLAIWHRSFELFRRGAGCGVSVKVWECQGWHRSYRYDFIFGSIRCLNLTDFDILWLAKQRMSRTTNHVDQRYQRSFDGRPIGPSNNGFCRPDTSLCSASVFAAPQDFQSYRPSSISGRGRLHHLHACVLSIGPVKMNGIPAHCATRLAIQWTPWWSLPCNCSRSPSTSTTMFPLCWQMWPLQPEPLRQRRSELCWMATRKRPLQRDTGWDQNVQIHLLMQTDWRGR